MTNTIVIAPRARGTQERLTIRTHSRKLLLAIGLAALAMSALSTPVSVNAVRGGSPAARHSSIAGESVRAVYRISGMSIVNPAQGVTARFGPGGAEIAVGAERFTLGLTGFGHAEQIQQVTPIRPRARGSVITYSYPSAVTEVWRNAPRGLDQGFMVKRRPGGAGALRFEMAAPAGSRLHAGSVSLPGGLLYSGLRATDARGRRLHAWLTLAHGRLTINVADLAARYPLRIDPIVQQARQTASDGVVGDYLGASIAVSGDTVVAGAPYHEVSGHVAQGALYVYSNSSGRWRQTAEITDTDGAADQYLGTAVAISGHTIVASAPESGTGAVGALFVFSGGGSHWTQVAELTASDAGTGDHLGDYSVAISGRTIVTGTPQQTFGSVSGQGAVYIYNERSGGWRNATQSAELTEHHGHADDYFGWSVALARKTLAVGEVGSASSGGHHSAIFVFTGGGRHWRQTAELHNSDQATYDELGHAVAVSGNTIVAPGGLVYVFQRRGRGWKQTAALTYTPICQLTECGGGGAGASVAFSGDAILATADDYSANGKVPAVGIAAYREFAGKWRQVSVVAVGKGATAGVGIVASSGDIVAAGVSNGSDKGSVTILKGRVTGVGNVIAGAVGTAGTGLELPVLCVLSAPCQVTVTADRFGTGELVATGKQTVAPAAVTDVGFTLTAAAAHTLATAHKLKVTITVHESLHGGVKASGSTTETFTQ